MTQDDLTTFKKDDVVYTQDGTQYYFDHVAGRHGYVCPIIIIQTSNYQGDDFEEHEEGADYLVPIPLDKLSKTPWVKKIHQETADAVGEKQAILSGLSSKIGLATVELRAANKALEDRTKELENEARILERRFQWVRDFRKMIGEDETHGLLVGDCVPINYNPREIRLKRDSSDPTKWYYLAETEDDDDRVQFYESVNAMRQAVWNLFAQKRGEMSVEDEIKWHKQWPNVPISDAAKTKMADDAAAKYDRDLKAAQGRVLQAQDNLRAVEAREKPPHRAPKSP